MKKVGLITFYDGNYGSILQCYATKTVIEQFGYECVILYQTDVFVKENSKRGKKIDRVHEMVRWEISDPLYFMRWIRYRKEYEGLTEKTRFLMSKFVEEYIRPIGCTWGQLCEIGESDDYVAFIVGSDQVWNFNNEMSPIYGLEFAPKSKRIAFSISLGVEKINREFEKKLKHNVSLFDEISVREHTAEVIVKKQCHESVIRLSDPTLIFDLSDWNTCLQITAMRKDKLILVHFLNHPSKLAIDAINMLLSSTPNCNLICIGYYYDVFAECGWQFQDCDPKEYLVYIQSAEMICTDSFHTTMFAINFRRAFYTFERQYLHGYPQTSRIVDLLGHVKLKNRYIKSMKNLKYISMDTLNYSYSDECLETERIALRKYLNRKMANI